MALAANDDLEAVIANYDSWRRAGADPDELAARYALTLSIAGLRDPSARSSELLRDALGAGDRLKDPKLREALAIRLILTLANEGNVEEALSVYDRMRREFELSGLSREELERSEAHRQLADTPAERRRGTLRFEIPGVQPGSALLLSGEPDAPVDTSFIEHPVPASGRIEVDRGIGTAPQRWAYRDPNHRTLASGTVSPVAGDVVRVRVEPREAREPQHVRLTRKSGDGRRRIILLLLDCGDWRIVEYLRARGELPTLDALIQEGHRAVLDSDSPLTAAALEALVWPNRRGAASFVGLVHRIGIELAGLASVGENPLAALSWVLPDDEDLFSALGAGRHSVANLLLAHGSIRAGKHSEVTGPFGRRRRIPLTRSVRDLRADERERWPALADALSGRDAVHVRTIAAEFDTAVEIVDAGEIDLMALRIEPLDILSHAHFAETARNGQDDGEHLLYSIYRYIDARIADVHDSIDADDVFIVMSDHGIRTDMEHSRHAIFVATGPGIPRGRAPGRPSLRGVPAVLGDLLGVQTDWPETGVAPWARALATTAGDAVAAKEMKPDSSPARATR
jgi:pentatricopeptide repeat protein